MKKQILCVVAALCLMSGASMAAIIRTDLVITVPIGSTFVLNNTSPHNTRYYVEKGGWYQAGYNFTGTLDIYRAGPPAGYIYFHTTITEPPLQENIVYDVFIQLMPGPIDSAQWGGVGAVMTRGTVFLEGMTYDPQPGIYYGSGTNELALLVTNSIATATTNNPHHVEVWPDRTEMAAARITEHSRSITWYCILYDKQRKPYRDTSGNILVFPVVPEWRKQSELYEEP